MMEKDAKHPVRTLEKSMQVIEVLREHRSARLVDLVDELDMGKSAVHNHLSTLREHEYVRKDGDRYSLGMRFLTLGGELRQDSSLYQTGATETKQLAEKTNELASLAMEEHGFAIILSRATGSRGVDIDTQVGSRVTMHNSALGKAMLAHFPEKHVKEILEKRGLPRFTENTITEPEELFAELEEIRERGYAIDSEERWQGLRCVATPILPKNGTMKGAISVSFPKNRTRNCELQEEYIDELKNASNVIELQLRYA